MDVVKSFLDIVEAVRPSAAVTDFEHPSDVPTVRVDSGTLVRTVGPLEAVRRFDLDTGDVIALASESLGFIEVRAVKKVERELACVDHYPVVARVLNVLMELGREGWEGNPVGTFCVVSDEAEDMYRKAVPIIVSNANVLSPEGKRVLKTLSRLDGAIVVNTDGTIEAAGAIFDVNAKNVEPGLGARHTTARHVSRALRCPVVVLSETGNVRLYHRGEEILKVSPR